MAVKKIAGRMVSSQPIAVQKKSVHVVGKNQLFDFHVFRPQPRHQIDGLREVHIAIVVAVNEEHRRTPGIYVGDRRRAMG